MSRAQGMGQVWLGSWICLLMPSTRLWAPEGERGSLRLSESHLQPSQAKAASGLLFVWVCVLLGHAADSSSAQVLAEPSRWPTGGGLSPGPSREAVETSGGLSNIRDDRQKALQKL